MQTRTMNDDDLLYEDEEDQEADEEESDQYTNIAAVLDANDIDRRSTGKMYSMSISENMTRHIR